MKTLRFVPLLLLLAGCQPSSSSQPEAGLPVAEAEKTVLARHDSLMAQMDQLYELRQQLAKAPATDTVAIGQARRALVGAENGMMDWMHRYSRPADTVADARRLAYYAMQQERIDSVGRLFDSSQAAAHQLLKAASASATPSSSVTQ
ncbi:hypothetical protein [Hymenobacter psychrophilus]|uniref:Uncharacterized protein n=1 Tax=Hymenobacter psychrophilus TaxID=651662 RepID=A0A1H3D5E9_9BACT|nr:hypothetical protein [Hymenobacter psychrophilus]SDX61605.1 hypothetical protein SAMN04488069_102228 [Hymenobacter psychrophilus]